MNFTSDQEYLVINNLIIMGNAVITIEPGTT